MCSIGHRKERQAISALAECTSRGHRGQLSAYKRGDVALKMMRHARGGVGLGERVHQWQLEMPARAKSQGLMLAHLETVLHYAIH
jgi:hypothetical protein